ncbi:pentapeptide repeat-containing protein [Pseudanabaenaceae cyanobacterium LEGE 13415]|nr:pentapeptide repeat-containing protein [Pseudanabaenaceae cyanobacterium LEGE 13415]
MNAIENLVRRYEAGERNFRHINLEGANLSNLDLKGADFGSANLRDIVKKVKSSV